MLNGRTILVLLASWIINTAGRVYDKKYLRILVAPVPCLVAVLVANMWRASKQRTEGGLLYTKLVTTGLILSAIGDCVMQIEYFVDECMAQSVFFIGAFVFVGVQICYIAAFLSHVVTSKAFSKEHFSMEQFTQTLKPQRALPFIIGTGLISADLIKRLTHDPSLLKFSIFYLVLVSVTCWAASSRIGQGPNSLRRLQILNLLGCLCFLACDIMVIYDKVFANCRLLTIINMTVYWIGQFAIALSCHQFANTLNSG